MPDDEAEDSARTGLLAASVDVVVRTGAGDGSSSRGCGVVRRELVVPVSDVIARSSVRARRDEASARRLGAATELDDEDVG
jgi:hypothetical protein